MHGHTSVAARQGSLGCLSPEAKTDDAPEAGGWKVLSSEIITLGIPSNSEQSRMQRGQRLHFLTFAMDLRSLNA